MLKSLVNKVEKIKIISSYYFFYSGNQSILNLFWPLFRFLAPLITGYITFGQILEQNSGKIPYKFWVMSGISIWMTISGALSTGIMLLNTRNRRKKVFNLSCSLRLILLSIVFPQFIVSFALSAFCLFDYKSNFDYLVIFQKITYLFIFHVMLALFCASISFLIAVFNALVRDTKMIVGFTSQLLLWISPVFYLPRKPNSELEIFLNTWNPLNTFLDISRHLIFNTSFSLTIAKFLIIFLCIITILIVFIYGNGITSKLIYLIDKVNADNFED